MGEKIERPIYLVVHSRLSFSFLLDVPQFFENLFLLSSVHFSIDENDIRIAKICAGVIITRRYVGHQFSSLACTPEYEMELQTAHLRDTFPLSVCSWSWWLRITLVAEIINDYTNSSLVYSSRDYVFGDEISPKSYHLGQNYR